MKKTIKGSIRTLLREASSGLKFTELYTKLLIVFTKLSPDRVEKAIREMPDVKMLEYSHELGTDAYRWKAFVFLVYKGQEPRIS